MTASPLSAVGHDRLVSDTTYEPLAVPRGLLVHRATHPAFGEYVGAVAAGIGGTAALAPIWLTIAYTAGWPSALGTWAVWVILGIVAAAPKPSNVLARALGSRTPTAEEIDFLRHALVRVCVAVGESPDAYTFRIAPGELNAYSAGRDVIAVTADLVSGRTSIEETELEAIVAHEIAHHRHGDSILAGALSWYMLPLYVAELLVSLVARIPIVGSVIARVAGIALAIFFWPIRAAWVAGSTGREFLADSFAADCGYAVPLERFFKQLARYAGSSEGGIIDVLTATHPPLADRIARLQDTVSNEAESHRELSAITTRGRTA